LLLFAPDCTGLLEHVHAKNLLRLRLRLRLRLLL